MTDEIVKYQSTSIIRTMDDAERAARAMANSGFFQDAKQASQALVKIMAGQELGFGPFASMTGVHIIKDKPSLGANLMASAIKRSGKYNYRVIKHDDNECHLEFFELFCGKWEKAGESRFTIDDAKKAGVFASNANWQKYPRNQLFARALSNGQKWYCPDAFNGATVYTPDEMGATVDEDGNAIITVQSENIQPTTVAPPAPKPDQAPVKLVQRDPGAPQAQAAPARPYSPDQLKKGFLKAADTYRMDKVGCAESDRHVVAAAIDGIFDGEKTKRYEVCAWLTDGTASTQKMSPYQVKAFMKVLGVKSFDDAPTADSVSEFRAAHTEALKAAGQQSLI